MWIAIKMKSFFVDDRGGWFSSIGDFDKLFLTYFDRICFTQMYLNNNISIDICSAGLSTSTYSESWQDHAQVTPELSKRDFVDSWSRFVMMSTFTSLYDIHSLEYRFYERYIAVHYRTVVNNRSFVSGASKPSESEQKGWNYLGVRDGIRNMFDTSSDRGSISDTYWTD